MSGMCAVVAWEGPVEAAAVRAMADAAAYRGTDGIGVWTSGATEGVAIAQQSVWVTPESVGQIDPVVHGPPDAQVVIAADARIDNRDELLGTLGLPPDLSDTRIIAAAYQRWGEACLTRLIGDLAFVLWDARRHRLVAGCDVMGMRTLHWWSSAGRVVVATEATQVLAAPHVPAHIDERMLACAVMGDFSVEPLTGWEGVSRLPAGHVLVAERGRTATRQVVRLDDGQRLELAREEEYADAFREHFTRAVAARMRSVRPVGILLSGGVDSSSVGSVAGWLSERDPSLPRVHAFCWAFEDLVHLDERSVSDHVVRRYRLAETDVHADGAWPLRDFPAHGPHVDEPYLGAFQPIIDDCLEAARQAGVGVLMGGDRGDLVLGGGIAYHPLLRQRRWEHLWQELLRHRRLTGEPLAVVIARYLLAPSARHVAWRVGEAVQESPGMRARREVRRAEEWATPRATELLEEAHASAEADAALLPSVAPDTPTEWAHQRRLEAILTPMHVRGMTWSERSYAAFGLAFADPFSDVRVARFAIAIPQQVLNRPGEDRKRLARTALAGIMPEQVRRHAQKVEPVALFDRGLRERGRPVVEELLRDSRLAARGLVHPHVLSETYEYYSRGGALSAEFWWTLAAEAWLRRVG